MAPASCCPQIFEYNGSAIGAPGAGSPGIRGRCGAPLRCRLAAFVAARRTAGGLVRSRHLANAFRSAPSGASCGAPLPLSAAPGSPSHAVAMAGKECVAIASDLRFGVQLQTLATDYKKIYRIHDQLFLGLAGLGTDAQTL